MNKLLDYVIEPDWSHVDIGGTGGQGGQSPSTFQTGGMALHFLTVLFSQPVLQ